jgi:hypothetical protein
MRMSAPNVVCFETFRSERDRQRAEIRGQASPAAAGTPVRDRLASVLLSPRQIAHRRAMLDFGRQITGPSVGALRAGGSERD